MATETQRSYSITYTMTHYLNFKETANWDNVAKGFANYLSMNNRWCKQSTDGTVRRKWRITAMCTENGVSAGLDWSKETVQELVRFRGQLQKAINEVLKTKIIKKYKEDSVRQVTFKLEIFTYTCHPRINYEPNTL